jgi:dTDP-4-dehydrorhamnose 3,5-epimerase-like enzyme
VLVAIVALTDDCLFYSAADRPFNRFDSQLTLDLFDPKLKIEWPKGVQPQLIEKDSKTVKLGEFLETI